MKYRLTGRMGSGGMAEVFRATGVGPEGFERPFVVKRIHPHLSDAPDFVRMFVDEAKICARILHPNVVQVFEFVFHEQRHYLVMEPVDGVDVARLLRRLENRSEVAPPTFVAELGHQVCRGLDFAHRLTDAEGSPLGIVHRDVTPPNIMVGWNGTVKILDFGLARVAHDLRADLTEAGTLKGKMSYFAPEQLEGRPADARSDVFSLGVVLHELLSGQRLFVGQNDLETLRMVREMPVPRPSLRNRAVQAPLEAAVMRALARDPAQRFRNAGEMADALEEIVLRERYSRQAFAADVRALCPASGAADEALEEPLQIGDEGSAVVSADAAPAMAAAVPASGAATTAAPARRPVRVPWVAALSPAALAAVVVVILLRHAPAPATSTPLQAPNIQLTQGFAPVPAQVAPDGTKDLPAPPPCSDAVKAVEAPPRRHHAMAARRSPAAAPAPAPARPSPATQAPETRATVRFRDEAGAGFRLVEAHFVMDDRPLPVLTGAQRAENTVIYAGPVRPGRHVVSARLVYQGSNRGPFTYLSGYKVNVESRKVVDVPADRSSSFTIATEKNAGLNVPFERQLAVTLRDDSARAMQ